VSEVAAFWSDVFAPFAGPSPLPDDLGAPTRSARVSSTSVALQLTAVERAAIDEAAEALQVAKPSLVLAAWSLVLRAYGQSDTGLFAEVTGAGDSASVPVPYAVDPLDSIRTWIAAFDAHRTQRLLRAASATEYREWSRFEERTPLTESVVEVCDDDPGAAGAFSAPLHIQCASNSGLLRATFDPARLRPQTASRILTLLRAALLAFADRADAPIDALSLFDISDVGAYEQLNATRVPVSNTCLHTLIEAQVSRTPYAVAVRYADATLTYVELNARANQLAHVLRDRGVTTESLVGVCVERSPEMLIALLAVLKAGGAYIPLDPEYPRERLASMLADAGDPLVLAQRVTMATLPDASNVLLLDDPTLTAGMLNSNLALPQSPDSLAYIVFTSGSTGRPKGALNEHRQIVNCLTWMQAHYALSADDRVLQKTPYSFDASICELFWPLLAGAEIVLAKPNGHKDPTYLIDTIVAQRITMVDFVPSMLRVFLENPRARECQSLRLVTCGGEALTVELKDAFYATLTATLTNLYGPTEAAVNVTYWDVPADATSVVIGKPVANTQVFVVDRHLRPMPVGLAGELCVAGAQVCRGYLNRPEETAEKFVPNPFSQWPGERMYRTGDLVRLRDDGELEFLGRIDQQVKLRGFRVELGEIESRLEAHASVRQAAVRVRNDRTNNPRLVAYLTGDSSAVSRTALREWLEQTMPDHMVPAWYVWLDAMPLTTSGKLDRNALPMSAFARPETAQPYVEPVTAREKALCAICADVLGFDPVGVDDNFFAMGGNSLLAIAALSKITSTLGITIPVEQFFERSSPRELAVEQSDVAKPAAVDTRAPRHRTRGGDAEPIAIIGMAGRFPGAQNVRELWQMICEGRSHVTRFTDADLDTSLPPELVRDPAYVKARGLINGYDQFDAPFFDINPREARLLDPQHRVLLETIWEALEHSGYVPETIHGLVGVYAGVYGNGYLLNHLLTYPEFQGQLDDMSVLLQNEKDYVATRVAHKLDLHGPAVSVHTACSTSLVAIAEAFWSLRTGQCDVAIAGAASITCPPQSGYLYQEGGMFSADGYTRPFDAAATGTTFNDGVAVVVLKRLSDAQADGDTIYGVLLGAAVNNDGSKKSSFTAPSVEGQAAVIRMALNVANVSADSIGYVEAHGTATPIGDPIEVQALTQAYRSTTDATAFCALGSVKSNIGHLVSAAGAAGVIKTAFALLDGVLPGTAHFTAPNPMLTLDQTPFVVSAAARPWTAAIAHPRRAGVSSFGVGGTNAHVIMEEAPLASAGSRSPRTSELLLLSARTADALAAATSQLQSHLADSGSAQALADVSATLARGRKPFRERRFVVADSHGHAAGQLAAPASCYTRTFAGNAPSVAFLFPGQGAQSPNMGRSLYMSEPLFRDVVDECASVLFPELGHDIRTLIYPDDDPESAALALSNTSITQPALFITEYATAKLFESWGVTPRAMIGHSIGEFVAAVIAGVMTLPDALQLVAARGRVMQSMSRGAMLSVRMSADALRPMLPESLDIASDNGPQLCVIAGASEQVAAFQAQLESQGVMCRELQTSHAFHSRMMDAAVPRFLAVVRQISLSAPQIPFVSTLTGTWITDAEATDPGYWARHVRETVQFRSAAATLLATPGMALLEVGPRNTLITLARQIAPDPRALLATSSLGASLDGEWNSMLTALGQLWCAGVAVDFDGVFAHERRLRVPLPTYAFDRKRYWMDPIPRVASVATTAVANFEARLTEVVHDGASAPSEQRPAAEAADVTDFSPVAASVTDRKPRIIGTLSRVFEEVSGFEVDPADEQVTFLELGLDSLSLTQVAQQLQKTFAIKVTFRELMEDLSSLGRLAAFFDERMPPDPAPATVVVARQPGSEVPSIGQEIPTVSRMSDVRAAGGVPMASGGAMQGDVIKQTIDQQLAIMQQQLALLTIAANGTPAFRTPAADATPSNSGDVSHASTNGHTSASLTVNGAARLVDDPAKSRSDSRADVTASESTAAPVSPYALPDESQLDAVLKKGFGAIARINKTKSDDLTPDQRARLAAFIRRYTKRTQRSKDFTQEHRSHLSDPRAVTGFRPQLKEMVYQVVIERSAGSHMWDLDGNEYVDTLSGFGCSLFGWQPDFATDAAIEQIHRGHEIGPMTPLAAEVAELICEMTGNERAAFCNTGSEAVMGCMRIARTVTGRDTIAIFNGSYHGIFDEVIVRGTKKLRSVPAAPGILPSTAQNVLILEYGDPAALEILRARGHELAAIMVEPVQSRRPDLQPKEFLHELRKIADECGAVYIFDEVITGFRCHPGGAQAYFDVRADLASYGKVIGGGYPFAVIAGKAQYLDALDGGFWQFGDDSVPTVGVTYFAGTFCRHPLALNVAKAVLQHLKQEGPQLQERLNARTTALAAELNAFFSAVGAPLEVRYFASLWKVFWLEEQPYGDLLFYYMRDKGIHILDMFPCFLTTAHSDADLAAIVTAFRESVTELQAGGFLPGAPAAATVGTSIAVNSDAPPVSGARLGRDPQGNPAWFVPDPQNPSHFVRVAGV
jgi:amino acid adenylation domain-containing protein